MSAALALLCLAACSPGEVDVVVAKNLALGKTVELGNIAPLRASSLFHQLCLKVPNSLEMGRDFTLTKGSNRIDVDVQLQEVDGRWLHFGQFSGLRNGGQHWACFSSSEVSGPSKMQFTMLRISSSETWTTPAVRWMSVEKL